MVTGYSAWKIMPGEISLMSPGSLVSAMELLLKNEIKASSVLGLDPWAWEYISFEIQDQVDLTN